MSQSVDLIRYDLTVVSSFNTASHSLSLSLSLTHTHTHACIHCCYLVVHAPVPFFGANHKLSDRAAKKDGGGAVVTVASDLSTAVLELRDASDDDDNKRNCSRDNKGLFLATACHMLLPYRRRQRRLVMAEG